MRAIELLAPAKDADCGIAAIKHGADAVYIGGTRYGARAAAANDISAIRRLCRYAHTFGAKVYGTLNTIIFDNEMDDALAVAAALADSGVDALLVQDVGLATELLRRGNMVLHASTQTDNRTVDKVRWLADNGFRRVVVARELSLDEIAKIHRACPDVEIEAFVHGALCVSYSGACYASQYCFGRSANRGECAQFCRLRFDVVDAAGNTVAHRCYPLSLRDMCRLDSIEDMLEAGVNSLKIEGRLKDESYVKNVVAAYSERLDAVISRHPDRYMRASRGTVSRTFEPHVERSFNRGFTDYFLRGRTKGMASLRTPKSIGAPVGKVKSVTATSIVVAGTASFANGDGLCFLDGNGELVGFRANHVEGNVIRPYTMPKGLRAGTPLRRNHDQAFERQLAGSDTAERTMAVDMSIAIDERSVIVTANDRYGNSGQAFLPIERAAEAQQSQADNIDKQLRRLGGTPFRAASVSITDAAARLFLPSSTLAQLRREAIASLEDSLERERQELHRRDIEAANVARKSRNRSAKEVESCDKSATDIHAANVANAGARAFYESHGIAAVPQAPENGGAFGALMTCRYCLRHELGYCVRHGGEQPAWREPLCLVLPDGKRFRLDFDCRRCEMTVRAIER